MSHALIPYRIEQPAAPTLQADLSLVDSLATDSIAIDSLAVDSLAVEVAPPPHEPLPFQTLTDYMATTEIETPYRDVTPEDMQKALRAVAGKYDIQVEITHQEYYAPADMESAAYAYTMDCLRKIFPRYPAAPYIPPQNLMKRKKL